MSLVVSGVIAGAGGFEFDSPVQPPRPVQVMAHRGESAGAPANSEAALRRCIEDGLEWASIDLRLTRDGHHVLSHDEHAGDRGAGGGAGRPIAESTLAELSEVDIGAAFAPRYAGERIPTLGEALALARGRLNLRLDCRAVDPRRLVREILEAGMERRVVVFDSVDRLRRIDEVAGGRLALMAKWRTPSGGGAREWVTTHRLAAVEIDADVIDADLCREFRAAGVRVAAEVLGSRDRPESWDRAIDAGADWLYTDRPDEVLMHAFRRRSGTAPVRFSLHRGAGRYAPENTMPAFEKSVRMGADYVEFDVRTTRDGGHFLLHDRGLDRTTDGSGPIDRTTAEAVSRLSAGVKFGRPYAAVRVPEFGAFLEAMKGRVDLYCDAKDIDPAALAAILDRHGVVERTVVYQTAEYLGRLRSLDPRIRALPPLRRAEDLAGLAATIRPFGVDVPWTLLSEDLVRRCHDLGIRVFSDAMGGHETVADYRRAIAWGIDVIQTDHPLRLLRAMELEVAGQPPAGRRP